MASPDAMPTSATDDASSQPVLAAWAVRTSSAVRPNFVRGPVVVTAAAALPRTRAPAPLCQ